MDVKPYPKLRGWLAEHNMTYTQLSIYTEIPLNTIKDRMRGLREWKLNEILKILAFTNETFEDLFK